MSTAPFQIIASAPYCRHSGVMLGDRIRSEIERLRHARGWSRPELGRRLNPPTSGQQIERLEKGQRQLDTDWIEKLSRALGVDPVELVAGEEQRYELTPPVADMVALELARFALGGEEPDPVTVEGLSMLIQDLSATFADDPQARRDPLVVRPVIRALARQRERRT